MCILVKDLQAQRFEHFFCVAAKRLMELLQHRSNIVGPGRRPIDRLHRLGQFATIRVMRACLSAQFE